MKYQSTRANNAKTMNFREAVLTGLAADGGLFVPASFPKIEASHGTLAELADSIIPSFSGEIGQTLCQEAFNFPIELQSTNPVHFLQLFHGPTAAFKDFGARFLARYLSNGETEQDKPTSIVVATSGDTGGAVASAFSDVPGSQVFILFPDQGVSPLQRQQLTCWGDNIHSFAVRGSFDDCQRMAKESLPQLKQNGHRLSSANSINIGRLIPQMTYYFWSSFQYQKQTGKPAHFYIPSGNLGNALACTWARICGAPIADITLATNANRTIVDYIERGEWTPRPSIKTLANAMDVGSPSNMERLRQLDNHRQLLQAVSVDDEEILKAIKWAKEEADQIICPHTATAYWAAKQDGFKENAIVVATAHPAKFREIVEPALQQKIELPENLARLMSLETRETTIEAKSERFLTEVEKRL